MFLTVVANCIVIKPIRVLFNACSPSFIEFKRLPLSARLNSLFLASSVVRPKVYNPLSISVNSSNNSFTSLLFSLAPLRVLPASDISAAYKDPNS